jgi:hypothetical protein
MNWIQSHVAFAIRGLVTASRSVAVTYSASLTVTGCASSGSSRSIEVAGSTITVASDSDCRAMQSGSARLWQAHDLPPFLPPNGLI